VRNTYLGGGQGIEKSGTRTKKASSLDTAKAGRRFNLNWPKASMVINPHPVFQTQLRKSFQHCFLVTRIETTSKSVWDSAAKIALSPCNMGAALSTARKGVEVK